MQCALERLAALERSDMVRREPREPDLFSLHVAPQWRGQGIGSRLVESFVSWARDRDVSRLRVTAYTANLYPKS